MDSSSFSVSSVEKNGNTDIPKELCSLINVNNNSTTFEVMKGLRDYIWQKRLFDPKQMKVLCKGDALEEILGLKEFTILEIKKLLEGFVFRLHSNEVLENQAPETICKDTPSIPFRETAKRKAEEELFEGIKGTEKRHCGHVECSETLSCAHVKKSVVSPMLLHIPPSPIEALESASESSGESVQNVETSYVVDSSDDSIYFDQDTDGGPFLPSGSILTIAETFEVEFEPNNGGDSDSLYSDSDASDCDSIMDLDSIITFVCKTDDDKEFWADRSSDEDPEFWGDISSDEDFDAEISEFDLWRCSSCRRLNNPKNRFCLKCFGMREGWLPEKPLSQKIPHALKRKPRSKRKKRSHKDDFSKFFKKEDLPSTSKEKSPSHEDFDLDKNTISPSPFLNKNDPKQNSDKKLCLVCCDKPVDSCIIHGKIGHQICCYRCARRFKRCPICRRMIEKVVYAIS